jgi:hypothetical protein
MRIVPPPAVGMPLAMPEATPPEASDESPTGNEHESFSADEL